MKVADEIARSQLLGYELSSLFLVYSYILLNCFIVWKESFYIESCFIVDLYLFAKTILEGHVLTTKDSRSI